MPSTTPDQKFGTLKLRYIDGGEDSIMAPHEAAENLMEFLKNKSDGLTEHGLITIGQPTNFFAFKLSKVCRIGFYPDKEDCKVSAITEGGV